METEKRDVFISYHTQSAGRIVEQLCEALEKIGISCWYAPRDVGPKYAQSIVEAIRGCRVFLLVLNKESNLSEHVLNEINCAFDRFKNHEDITLLPFRIDDCQLSDDVYYYLGRIHIMEGMLPPDVLRIKELIDRISVLLGISPERRISLQETPEGDLSGSAPDKASADEIQVKTYRLNSSMVYPDNGFVGRQKELAQLHENLSGSENKALLAGMGGIGKSEIAKMYIKRYLEEDYDVVLWISFADSLEQTLINDYAFPIQGLSRTDYPEEDDRAYFLRKLRILKELGDRRILIVIDNFDVVDDENMEEFCSGTYSVLFTTRYHQESRRFPEIEIREMSDEGDLMALFRTEYSRSLDDAGLEQVKEILKELNGHPLSIRLVASAMQSRRIAPAKMLELLKEGMTGMVQQNARAADMIFGRLKQVFQLSTLNEEEQYILKNLSLIPLCGISVETLYDWCGADDFDVIDELIRKSWVIHNPATDEVHLHPLVADLMSEALEGDPDCCSRLLQAVVDAADKVIGTTYEYKCKLRDIIYSADKKLPGSHPMHWVLSQAKANITMEMCLYDRAAGMYRELGQTAENLQDRLFVCNKLAHCYALSGYPEESRKIAQEGYALVTERPVDELSMKQGYYYVELLHRLVETNRDLGDYETAVSYGRKAVALQGRFHMGTMQGQLGWSEYHLGRALYKKGDLEESEKWMLHAISLFEEVHDLWSVSFCYEILAMIQMERKNFEEALDYNRRAYDIRLPQLGSEHRDTGVNLEWRGKIYFAMGDAQKASGCYRQASSIYRKKNCLQDEKRLNGLLKECEESLCGQ